MRGPLFWPALGVAFLAVTAGVVVFAVTNSPRANYAFRLTIRVLVGDDVRSGSSVIAVSAEIPPRWLPGGGGFVTRVRGEAVFVDLGTRGNLVGLLGCGPNAAADCIAALPLRALGLWISDGPRDMKRLSELSGAAELKGEDIPTLVTFGDLTDPSTARVIGRDELARVFGPDVRFGGAFSGNDARPADRKYRGTSPVGRRLRR